MSTCKTLEKENAIASFQGARDVKVIKQKSRLKIEEEGGGKEKIKPRQARQPFEMTQRSKRER